MTADPISMSPETELAEAASVMTAKHLRCLPVLRDLALVGVISRSDILRALATRLIGPVPASDAAWHFQARCEAGARPMPARSPRKTPEQTGIS